MVNKSESEKVPQKLQIDQKKFTEKKAHSLLDVGKKI